MYSSRLEKGVGYFSSYCFRISIVKVMASSPGGDLIYGYLVDGWFERFMIGNNHLCAMAQNRYTFFTCYSWLYDIMLWNSMFFAGAVRPFPNA